MPDYSIPNLGNACRLLRHLSDQRSPMGIGHLAQALKLPRTTCLRIVHTLHAEGFLREKEGAYSLGSAVIPIGLKALQDMDLHAESGPVLASLAERTGETAHLAILSEARAVIINVCDSAHPLRAASRPGTRAFCNCSATGKILLAFNHLEHLEDILPESERARQTPRSIMDLQELRLELRKVQALGWALDDEEYHEGVRCLAAPVRNALGEVCAAIGITAASLRFPVTKNAEIANEVCAAASQLSLRLGWKL